MGKVLVIALAICLAAPLSHAESEAPPKDEKGRESYSLGYEFGARLKKQGVEVDTDILIAAVKSGLAGKDPSMAPGEMNSTLRELRKKIMVTANKRSEEAAARNLEKGKAFLEENRTKEGVVVLPSGLQYRVLREGNGAVPKATDSVAVNYRGTLVDGTEFDNSQKRGEPAVISVRGAIKGWSEALQLMKTGSKWQIFVPPELAYGKRQFGRIAPQQHPHFRNGSFCRSPRRRIRERLNPDRRSPENRFPLRMGRSDRGGDAGTLTDVRPSSPCRTARSKNL